MVKPQSCLRRKSSGKHASKSRMITRRRSRQLEKKVHFPKNLGGTSSERQSTPLHLQLRSSAVRTLFVPTKSIEQLPNEIITHVFTFFNIKELMPLRCVNRRFFNVIDGNHLIWSRVSYQDLWPKTQFEKDLFERGTSFNNKECLVKLGLSHLYHYNLISGAEKNETLVNQNAGLAASYFNRLDNSIAPRKPVTWMLIRPPWSVKSMCVKQAIHLHMKEMARKTPSGNLLYNIGRVNDFEKDNNDTSHSLIQSLAESTALGCSHATVERLMLENVPGLDYGRKLQWTRELKECVQSTDNIEAKFMLVQLYIMNRDKNFDCKISNFCSALFQSATCSRIDKLESYQSKINSLMRCILVDWLAEVAYIKDMSHQVIHAAIRYVDEFLTKRVIERTKLQLLGITCLLLAAKSHYDPRPLVHILTVREASWLTDQTYQYEDVVKMMGEILGTVKSDIWMQTSWNYLDLMHSFSEIDCQTKLFSHYIHDLSLQFTCFGSVKPSLLAASCVFFANIVFKNVCPWPKVFENFTGFTVKDVSNGAALLYHKCVSSLSMKDDRDLPLKSIREEYMDELKNNAIAKTTLPEITTFRDSILALDCALVCVSEEPLQFEYIDDDENILNMSVKSVDYDGDCDSDWLSDAESAFEESFSVRARLSSFVDEFSDDETLDSDVCFNKKPDDLSPHNLSALFRNETSAATTSSAGVVTQFEKNWLLNEDNVYFNPAGGSANACEQVPFYGDKYTSEDSGKYAATSRKRKSTSKRENFVSKRRTRSATLD